MAIIAEDRTHLEYLMNHAFKYARKNCSFNNINVSRITDMSNLFSDKLKKFNGDISKWDVSNVENMRSMFYDSEFNGDISKWNVSQVKNMESMFSHSKFNKDISKWNTKNVKNMSWMFFSSQFNQDLSQWDVSNVEDMDYFFLESMFDKDLSLWKPLKASIYKLVDDCPAPFPYWAFYEKSNDRNKAIEFFHQKLNLNKQLENELNLKNNKVLKNKI